MSSIVKFWDTLELIKAGNEKALVLVFILDHIGALLKITTR